MSASEMYTGYCETDDQIADRWQRIKAKSFACDVYGELTDTEAAALRWALVLAETEDEREAQNREAAGVVEWLHENNAALYMEGTEPSPFIWGGEVCYPSEYRPATEPDDDIPF